MCAVYQHSCWSFVNNVAIFEHRYMIRMKRLFFLIALTPTLAFGQLGDYDFYVSLGFGRGFGLSEYEYLVSEAEDMYGDSISTFYTPGNAWIPEFTFGIKMTRNFYIEAGYIYLSNKSYQDFGGSNPYPESYVFNRSAFMLNALYYFNVNPQMNVYMGGGASYYMPSKLHMQVLHTREMLNYAGSLGLQGTFGFLYRIGLVAFRAGLRYRWEHYQLKSNQDVSTQRLIDNPELQSPNATAFDINAGIIFSF